MSKEDQLLSSSIKDTFDEAYKALHAFHVFHSVGSIEEAESLDESHDQSGQNLTYFVRKLVRDVLLLAERLGLPRFCDEFLSEMRPLLRYPHSYELIDGVEPHSEVLSCIRGYFESLLIVTEGTSVTGISIFESILENTAAIIFNQGIVPTNEKDVERAIYDVMRYSFHDIVSQPTLNKIMKNYKAELGVKSLMAAVEYKFALNENQAKVAIDGFYADMRGYSNDRDWRNFYAVIYTPSPLLNQKRLEEEFRISRADLNWRPMLVHGPVGIKPSKTVRNNIATQGIQPQGQSSPSGRQGKRP